LKKSKKRGYPLGTPSYKNNSPQGKIDDEKTFKKYWFGATHSTGYGSLLIAGKR